MPESDVQKIISELGTSINDVGQSDFEFFKEIQKRVKIRRHWKTKKIWVSLR